MRNVAHELWSLDLVNGSVPIFTDALHSCQVLKDGVWESNLGEAAIRYAHAPKSSCCFDGDRV